MWEQSPVSVFTPTTKGFLIPLTERLSLRGFRFLSTRNPSHWSSYNISSSDSAPLSLGQGHHASFWLPYLLLLSLSGIGILVGRLSSWFSVLNAGATMNQGERKRVKAADEAHQSFRTPRSQEMRRGVGFFGREDAAAGA